MLKPNMTKLDLEVYEEREKAVLYLMNMQNAWPELKEGEETPIKFHRWRYIMHNGHYYFDNGVNMAISLEEIMFYNFDMAEVNSRIMGKAQFN